MRKRCWFSKQRSRKDPRPHRKSDSIRFFANAPKVQLVRPAADVYLDIHVCTSKCRGKPTCHLARKATKILHSGAFLMV